MEPTLAEFEQSLIDAIRKAHENDAPEEKIEKLQTILTVVQLYRCLYQVFKI